MNKFFKPVSLIFYLLTVVVFLLIGMTYASISGAANGQGLAGGAIVLVYGIMFALAAFITALFVVFYFSKNIIVIANRILLIILVIAIVIITYRILVKERQATTIEDYPQKPTSEFTSGTKYFQQLYY